jgi:hypothetical protein
LATYQYFADRDPLQRAVMDRMLAGVSTRKFARVGEPVGDEVEQAASAKSKSSVSEVFIERTRTALEELMARRLEDMRLAVMMLDGLDIAERCHVVALGITTDGVKVPLGLWEGSTVGAHQPRHRTPGRRDALTPQLPPHLAHAIQAAALIMDPTDLLQQLPISQRPRGRLTLSAFASPIRRRGDLQHAADRLNPEPVSVLVDEHGQLLGGRGSSSRAKKADAAFKISLARRNSRFSRSSSLMRSASAVVLPGRLPPSTSTWRIHNRSVSGVIPNFSAIDVIAAH